MNQSIRFRRVKTAAIAGFAGLLLGLGLSASAQDDTNLPGFLLLPSTGTPIAVAKDLSLSYSSNGGALTFGRFAPMRETKNGWLLYDLGLAASFSKGLDVQSYDAHAGLVFRKHLDDISILGFNTYVEGGRNAKNGDFMGQFSLGVEYERRQADKKGFIQLGANAYVPFDDYTNIANFGVLNAAPRKGLDAYASFGKDFDGFSLRGSVIGFDYAETNSARGLNGYGVDLDVEYWKNLPPGMKLNLSVGLRDDNRTNTDAALRGALGMNWTFGKTGGGRPSTEDCAVVRDALNQTTVDCGEQVIRTPGRPLYAKDGTALPEEVIASPAPRGVSVIPPRRNLGFGTPSVPIEYKPSKASVRLVKTASGGNDSFSFVSTIAGLPTSLTTTNGTATTAAVEADPGSYTITETAIPADWSFTSASCTGASTSAPVANGVSLTLVAGDNAVCTFTNTADPVPQVRGTPGGGIFTSTPKVNKFQINKIVVGAAAPAANFIMDGSIAALDVTLSGTGGPQTIAGPIVTVTPGTYSFEEINVPAGFAITDVTCKIAGDLASCDVTNTYTPPAEPSVKLVKKVIGQQAPVAEFSFVGSDAALNATLTGTGGAQDIEGQVVQIAPGEYTITEENLPEGFTLTDLNCTGTTVGLGDLDQRSIDITLAAGEAAVCTFTNSYTPPGPSVNLTLTKTVCAYGKGDPAPAASFGFTATSDRGTSNFTVDTPEVAAPPGTNDEHCYPISTIAEPVAVWGDITLQETTYDPTLFEPRESRASCTMNGEEYPIEISNGGATLTIPAPTGDLECNMWNRYLDPNSMKVNKQVIDETGSAPRTEFTFRSDRPTVDYGDFNATLVTYFGPNTPTLQEGNEYLVLAGPITITEDDPGLGWEMTGATCTGATITNLDLATRSLTLTVTPTSKVECTFENTYTPVQNTLTLTKQFCVNPGDDAPASSFDFSVSSDLGTTTQSINTPIAPAFDAPDGEGCEVMSRAGEPIGIAGEVTIAETGLDDELFEYQFTSCTSEGADLDITQTADGATFAAPDADVACTVQNNFRDPGRLQINKTVVTSGTAPAATFTFETDETEAFGIFQGADFSFDGNTLEMTGDQRAIRVGDTTITEQPLPEGWEMTGVTCTGNTPTVDLANQSFTLVDVSLKDIIECTVENTYTPVSTGNLTITKTITHDVAPSGDRNSGPPDGAAQIVDATDFSFGGLPSGTVTISHPGTADTYVDSGPISVPTDAPLTISEANLPYGFTLESVTCIDTDTDALVGEPAPGGATLTIGEGQNVDCTFSNHYAPTHFSLRKDVLGVSANGGTILPWDFEVEIAGVTQAPVTLYYPADSTHSPEQAFLNIEPGTVTITEDLTANPGYTLESISCYDAAPAGDGALFDLTLTGNSATLDIEPGQQIVCEAANKPPVNSSIQVVKKVVSNPTTIPAPAASFTFTSATTGLAATLESTGGDETIEGDVIELSQNSYRVKEENLPPNFFLTDITCTGGADVTTDILSGGTSGEAVIALNQNEDVVCTFTNTYIYPPTSLTITKVIPDFELGQVVPTFGLDSSFAGLDGQSLSLDPTDASAASITVTVPAGIHSITEDLAVLAETNANLTSNNMNPVRYDSLTCDGGTVSPIANGVNLTLSGQPTVACTLTNVEDVPLATVTFTKYTACQSGANTECTVPAANFTLDLNGDQDYSLDVSIPERQTSANTASQASDVPTLEIEPGTYVVSELVNGGPTAGIQEGSPTTSQWLQGAPAALFGCTALDAADNQVDGVYAQGNGSDLPLTIAVPPGGTLNCEWYNTYADVPLTTVKLVKLGMPRPVLDATYVEIDQDGPVTTVDTVTMTSAGCVDDTVTFTGTGINQTVTMTGPGAGPLGQTDVCVGESAEFEVAPDTAIPFTEDATEYSLDDMVDYCLSLADGTLDQSPYFANYAPLIADPTLATCNNINSSAAGWENYRFGIGYSTGQFYIGTECYDQNGNYVNASSSLELPPLAAGTQATCYVQNLYQSAAPSDMRLKTNIVALGAVANGHALYAFDYIDGMGLPQGRFVGVMAQDLIGTANGRAVVTMANGYYAVRYGQLGLRMVTWDDWQRGGLDAVAAPIAASLTP